MIISSLSVCQVMVSSVFLILSVLLLQQHGVGAADTAGIEHAIMCVSAITLASYSVPS